MPQYAIERLHALTRGHDTYITTEVGQHQMWAAQYFGFEEPNRFMTVDPRPAEGWQVSYRDSQRLRASYYLLGALLLARSHERHAARICLIALVGTALSVAAGAFVVPIADGSPLLFVGLVGFALWLVWLLAPVLMPFVLAATLAYLGDPRSWEIVLRKTF